MMQTADLIFQASAIMSVDDRRCDEHEQVTLGARIEPLPKQITNNRDIAKHGNLAASFRLFVLEQPADSQSIPALNQNIRVECASINDRAGHGCTGKHKRLIT